MKNRDAQRTQTAKVLIGLWALAVTGLSFGCERGKVTFEAPQIDDLLDVKWEMPSGTEKDSSQVEDGHSNGQLVLVVD